MAIIKPEPRTVAVEKRVRRDCNVVSSCAPTDSARSGKCSREITSNVASPAPQASAFPAKVEVCTTSSSRRQASSTAPRPTTALIGRPPPKPLPRHSKSGVNAGLTEYSIFPERPSPVQISSAMHSAPNSRANLPSSGKNSAGGTITPPRPKIGSTRIAPTAPSASAARTCVSTRSRSSARAG